MHYFQFQECSVFTSEFVAPRNLIVLFVGFCLLNAKATCAHSALDIDFSQQIAFCFLGFDCVNAKTRQSSLAGLLSLIKRFVIDSVALTPNT